MKRGTTQTLTVTHTGLDLTDCAKIEYVFKASVDPDAAVLAEKSLTAPITAPVTVTLTAAETRRFPAGIVYMDTRVTKLNGDVPETSLVRLTVDETLFGD